MSEEPEIIEADVMEEEILTSKPLLRDKAMTFATLVASGAELGEAYKIAFPEKAHSKWVQVYAGRLAKNSKVKEHIALVQEATRLQIVLETPAAFERLVDLAENAKSEKVRLDANKDLLDRGGLKPPERIESINVGVFGSLSSDDMKAIIRSKLGSE
jgi:hypothetical protein